MKPIVKEWLIAAFMGLILPWLLVNGLLSLEEGQRPTEPAPEISASTPEGTEAAKPITMRFHREDGTVEQMDMDEYLVGVLLAELPASFEMEAKKAQSVAARTFTLKALVTGGKHGDGSVCGSYACCQAYRTPEDYINSGGTQDAVQQAREAVTATSGYVLTYESNLIEATYFSCSGGSTEDAVAVWGSDYPYLRAVSSPGEEGASHYTDSVYFTETELEDALGTSLYGEPSEWFGFTTYTAGGGVNTVRIGGKDYRGTDLRWTLGLRSTAFTVTPDSSGVTITTRGFGHRVGMSQYGADAMAAAGSSFEEILAHYYGGTSLERWEPEEN